jgi:hypothetical protein
VARLPACAFDVGHLAFLQQVVRQDLEQYARQISAHAARDLRCRAGYLKGRCIETSNVAFGLDACFAHATGQYADTAEPAFHSQVEWGLAHDLEGR